MAPSCPPSGDTPVRGIGAGSVCPDDATWEEIRTTAGGSADPSFLDHVGRCPACSDRLAAMACDWSRTECLADPESPADDSTTALVSRLFVRDAGLPAHGSPPTVAGLDGLVEVGRGGMGVVYRAHDPALGRTVAVKLLTAGAARSPEGRARAEREARLLARVDHPNIVRILAVTEAGGLPAIVMEWIDGESLAERGAPGGAEPGAAGTIVRDLARAVAALHAAGIIHRDIKPANVLLERRGDLLPPRPKLVDFGLARPDAPGPSPITHPSMAVGTPSFMAPEQTGLLPDLGAVGRATDVHALGALLYWLLSGRAPYEDRTPLATLHRAAHAQAPALATLVPGLPADLRRIVADCLVQRPERRYRSAGALADDLDRFLLGRPILGRGAGPIERGREWARRHPVRSLAIAGALSLLVAAGIALAGVLHGHSARATARARNDEARAAETLAREAFDRLTDAASERLLARGAALGGADHDHLLSIADRYRTWPVGADTAADARYRAAGLERVARILARLNWTDDAVDAARDGRGTLDEAGLDSIGDEVARLRLLYVETNLLHRAGKIDEATALVRPALSRLDARADRDDPAFDLPRAQALALLATMESRAGRLDEARGLFGKSTALLERRLAASPDDAELRAEMVPVLFNSAVSRATADPEEKIAAFGRLADVAREGLFRGTARRFDLGRGLLLGLRGQADHELALGRIDDALGHARELAATARSLAGEMPGSGGFADQAIGAASVVFRCLSTLGRPGDAETELAEAVAIGERNVAAEPAVIGHARVLAEALESRAAMFLATGRRRQAIDAHRRIVATILPWTEGEAADDFFRTGLSTTRATIDRLEAEEAAETASRSAE